MKTALRPVKLQARSSSVPSGKGVLFSPDLAGKVTEISLREAILPFPAKMEPVASRRRLKSPTSFDVEAFLNSTGLARKITEFRRRGALFSQGDSADHVIYIQKGGVKLSVVNDTGKEAVVAMLGPGDFVGEGCLAGQTVRMATATAITSVSAQVIKKGEMTRVLHVEHSFSDLFVSYMLTRNIRIEEDLVDQLFNSSEKRLARALLLLARYGKSTEPQKVLHSVSQETLMNKFRKLGFIKYNGGLHINSSLLSVVLHD
jgi:CRP-like cAMP-binding protein